MYPNDIQLSQNKLTFKSLTIKISEKPVFTFYPREKLRIPKIFSSNKYLYLGNRALEQLDVITSLLPIINFTKTSIGKRYLNNMLISNSN